MIETPEYQADPMEELKHAYAAQYPPGSTGMSISFHSPDDLLQLTDYDNLEFQVWFYQGEPQITVRNTTSDVCTTLGSSESRTVLASLSPLARKAIFNTLKSSGRVREEYSQAIQQLLMS